MNQEPTGKPEQPSLQQRPSEKVIQPLNPTLTPQQAAPQPLPTSNANANNAAPSSYDPTADGYAVPKLDLRKPLESHSFKTVAMQHKSLLILAIIGLFQSAFSLYATVQASHNLQQAQSTNANQTGGSQVLLDVLYVTIAINVLINVYFLIARDRHTVATILKVLLVLDLISVFGIWWGFGSSKGINLLINGTLLLYTYIVFNIVKTDPAI